MSNTNRAWMYRRRGGELTTEFREGINSFLQHCFQNPDVDIVGGRVRCPCKKCRNRYYHSKEDIKLHLYKNGFVQNYERWTCHGERHNNRSFFDQGSSRSGDGVAHNTPTNVGNPLDEYVRMVYDAYGIDSDATNVTSSHVEEDPNPEEKMFYNMLAAGDKDLWPGCKKMTLLSIVARLLNAKSEHNLSERCIDTLCQIVLDSIPDENCMIKNFYEAKKLLEGLGLPVQKIDCCQMGCMLYWRGDAELSNCKFCGRPRYKDTNNNTQVAHKYMFYFPLKNRLKRLYTSEATAKFMRWHADHTHGNEGEMCHPCDSEAWKHFDIVHPEFASEKRNVRLGLCTDGFQPFGQSGSQYSCWPIILSPYNLPPNMCMKEEYMFLTAIVPGRSSPKQRIDVYLQPLIAELQELWEDGVTTFDISLKQNFQMKAALMWTIGDLPAYAMMSGWGTAGKTACPVCMEETEAIRLKVGGKQSWFDAHRRFLPANHPYRQEKSKFRKDCEESRPPPRLKSGDDVLKEIEDFGLRRVIDEGGEAANKLICKNCGWKKRSIFWDLPYWKTNLVRHNLDVMHIEKNVFENVFNTVMDVDGKTKDNAKARADMASLCNRPELERHVRTGKYPKAKYTLEKDKRDAFLKWVAGLKFPDGYVSNLGRCIDMNKLRMFGMKSHDCHVFMQRLLPIGTRELLPKAVWEAITELSNFFRSLTARTITVNDMKKLEVEIPIIICKLETIFPPAFFDSMEHLPIHLPSEAKIAGPVQFRWMYPYERYLNRLKRTVKNKAHVEGSICNAYTVRESSIFCSHYFEKHVYTRERNVPRNDDGGLPIHEDQNLTIFKYPGRAQGKPKKRQLTKQESIAAHNYVLMNCTEIEPYIAIFEESLRNDNPCVTMEQITAAMSNHFAKWFEAYVRNNPPENLSILDVALGPLPNATVYPMYFVNGQRFHTETHGSKKSTYNSGVCITSSIGEYFGKIEEIIVVEYPAMPIKRCVLFKCKWYDPTPGIGTRIHEKYKILEVNHTRTLNIFEPFILAHQAEQVCYVSFPTTRLTSATSEWLAVCKVKPRGWMEILHGAENEAFQADAVEPIEIDTSNVTANRMQLTDDVVQYVDMLDDGLRAHIIEDDDDASMDSVSTSDESLEEAMIDDDTSDEDYHI